MGYTKKVKDWLKAFTKKLSFEQLGLGLAIVGLAFGLRVHRYWEVPIGGETQDESAWAFLGASLIQTGQPTSWSFFAPYEPDYIFARRDHNAPLVRPALDHPPLFSLLPGLAHGLKSDWQNFPSLKVIRLPMVLLGTLNVALLMLAARQFFGQRKWIYVAGLIYSVAPSFVLSSRLVVAENLIVTWTLLALWALSLKNWRWQSLMLVAIGAAAVLTKVSGLVVPVAIFLVGLAGRDRKIWQAGLMGSLVGLIGFAIFGALHNWSLWLAVLGGQAGRELGWATLQNRFFVHPSLVEKFFFDGWVWLGLMSVPWVLLKKEAKFLSLNLFIILNLFFIGLSSGEQSFHGWYDYALYPLLVLAMVEVLAQIFANQNWLLFSLTWLLALPVLRVAAVHGDWYHQVPNLVIRLVATLGFVPFLASQLKFLPVKQWSWLSWLLVAALLAASAYAVLVFNQVSYWEDHQFFSQW